jgi:hypothetical protein
MHLGGDKSAPGISSPLLLGLDHQRVLILGCDDPPEREHAAVLPNAQPQADRAGHEFSLNAQAATFQQLKVAGGRVEAPHPAEYMVRAWKCIEAVTARRSGRNS